MVRRSRDDGLVGQSLAQRRLRLLDGNEMHRTFQPAMGGLAAEKLASRSDAARGYRQGASDGR